MYLYSPDNSKRQESLPPFEPNPDLRAPKFYEPSPELADAVNVALRLGLPLLVTGAPGTGKTELAHHIAWFFHMDIHEFHAKTTSTANDLFYRYDALGHFQYSQNNKEPLTKEQLEGRFIEPGPFKKAFEAQKRCVVLIDEIDKAPRDLPNDVLDAVDKMRFFIPEIDKEVTTTDANRPVIVMTSNSEKNLPDAFLRRVVYFHIDFPRPDKMLGIVARKVGQAKTEDIEAAVKHFYQIVDDKDLKLNKKPATAELIQWAGLLADTGFPLAKLSDPDRLTGEERSRLLISYSVLAKTREDLKALKEWL